MINTQIALNHVHPDDRAQREEVYQKSIKEHQDYEFTYRIRLNSGKVKYIHELGKHYFDENKVLIKSIGTAQDITSAKLKEIELDTLTAQNELALENIITAVSRSLEVRDPYTAGHQYRVAQLAKFIAQKLNWPKSRIKGVYLGAIIHDIGKLVIPASILAKPTALSEQEYELIKIHPEHGSKIFHQLKFPWPIEEIIVQHHERLDGSGYPHQLVGEQICMEAKVVAVCDVFESIMTDRPYRHHLGVDNAINTLLAGRDTLFEAAIVDILIEHKEQVVQLLHSETKEWQHLTN